MKVEIGLQLDFEHQRHFTRLFKELNKGVTPSSFRNNKGEDLFTS